MVQTSRAHSPAAVASKIRQVLNLRTFSAESSAADSAENIGNRVSRVPPPSHRKKPQPRPINKRVLYQAAIAEHRNIKQLEDEARRAQNERRSQRLQQRVPKKDLAQHGADDRATERRRTPKRHNSKEEGLTGNKDAGGVFGFLRHMMSSKDHHKNEPSEESDRQNDDGRITGSTGKEKGYRRHHPKEERKEDRESRRAERRVQRPHKTEGHQDARRSQARTSRDHHENIQQERDKQKYREADRPSTRDRSIHSHHRRRTRSDDRRTKEQERGARLVARRAVRQAEEERRLREQERQVSRATQPKSHRDSKGAVLDVKSSTSTFTDTSLYRTRDESQLEEEINEKRKKDREAAKAALLNYARRKIDEERKEAERQAMVKASERILASEVAKREAEEKQDEEKRLQEEEERLAEERSKKEAEEKEKEASFLNAAEKLANEKEKEMRRMKEEMERQLAEERAKRRAEERDRVARQFKEEKAKKLAEEKAKMALERKNARKQAEAEA
ncbi:hypothetical protein NW752_007526 [Fusarium irregulare]|uniref:Uncharacterized protein n=1 Tax=Fusarium irregulare TaxID=2494466 RepID=A0A9W8PIZ5_9HYPO|nr:hypothetical protein NW766_010180 [Fusarium irregulare]KAJ4013231.1 hypothetical protein NW752_007526 [Fusarium irregulare]